MVRPSTTGTNRVEISPLVAKGEAGRPPPARSRAASPPWPLLRSAAISFSARNSLELLRLIRL